MGIITSHQFSTIRGSIDDTTYYAGPGHPIMSRARVTPTNTPSQYRTWIRSCPATFKIAWNNRPQYVRDGWAAWAATLPPPGEVWPHRYYGHHVAYGYYSIIRYMNLFGMTPQSTSIHRYPKLPGWFNADLRDVTKQGLTSIRLRVWNSNPERSWLVAWISPALPFTRNWFKGPFDASSMKRQGIVGTGGTNIITFTGLTRFKRYFVRYRMFSYTNDRTRYSPSQFTVPVDL